MTFASHSGGSGAAVLRRILHWAAAGYPADRRGGPDRSLRAARQRSGTDGPGPEPGRAGRRPGLSRAARRRAAAEAAALSRARGSVRVTGKTNY